MTVSHDRLQVSPFTRPARSETKNQCFFSNHPNMSGVSQPKRLPPDEEGKGEAADVALDRRRERWPTHPADR